MDKKCDWMNPDKWGELDYSESYNNIYGRVNDVAMYIYKRKEKEITNPTLSKLPFISEKTRVVDYFYHVGCYNGVKLYENTKDPLIADLYHTMKKKYEDEKLADINAIKKETIDKLCGNS